MCNAACQLRHLRWELLGDLVGLLIAVAIIMLIGRAMRPTSTIPTTLTKEQS